MTKNLSIEELEKLKLNELRQLASKLEIKSISALRKADLIERIAEKFKEENTNEQEDQNVQTETNAEHESGDLGKKFDVAGHLELLPDGYGFLRMNFSQMSNEDIYVSPTQIRRFKLKTGDYIEAIAREKRDKDKFAPLIFVKSVNNLSPVDIYNRTNFEDLTPIFPQKKICLEMDEKSYTQRIIDLVSPIGRGQRGLVVAAPKSGKTTILKSLAYSIEKNYYDIKIIILLVDERPEEVTDIKRFVNQYRDKDDFMSKTEVYYSTFDQVPQNHVNVSEFVLEKAKRLVESKKDVVILMDSITRLARAYNITTPQSGRTLSGGLDPLALVGPKKFFGSARNIEGGGSLSIIATTLVDTGSRMDDVIYEEFKGTGNMELQLDRSLSERRIFPAINIFKSGTRRDDLLLNEAQRECMYKLRNIKDKDSIETTKEFLNWIKRTKSNDEFVKIINNQL